MRLPQVSEIPGKYIRKLYADVQWQDEYGVGGWNRTEAMIEDAEVVSSEISGSKFHAPVLDLDFPAFLIESSTPGHFHLYLDKAVPWCKYKRVLRALAAADIIERGYTKASIRRKHTAVRVPWLKKTCPLCYMRGVRSGCVHEESK